jgi:CheY-like chemotaxis protein
MTASETTPRQNILLVDDDPEVREILRLLLSVDKHHVTEAASGRDALKLFTGGHYDVVITDYLMPEMRGDDLAEAIHGLEPAQPVIMVTAYRERLLHGTQPRYAVLSKPVSVEDLRRALPPLNPSRKESDTGFTRRELLHRASATTTMLGEILEQKRPASCLPEDR